MAIVVCVIFISLSSLGEPTSTEGLKASIPVFVPILFSLTVPVFQSSNIMVTKITSIVYKAPGRDYTFAFFLVFSFATFVTSCFYFYSNEGSFDFNDYMIGAIGSTC